ncbi:MAG: hypothetical protein R6V55_00120 [Desulfovermiculus sp.]
MCEQNNCCQKPEQLKDTPGNCTPEQINICHGEAQGHPCTFRQQEEEKKE